MIKNVNHLTIKYNKQTVGYLVESNDGRIVFQYDTEWLAKGFPISPLSLPLSNKTYINTKDTFSGLFGVFQDSLPDGWGALLQKRFFAKQGISIEKLSPLTRLSLIGSDGHGALKYIPTQNTNNPQLGFDLDILAKESIGLFNDIPIDTNLDILYTLCGSSGGARPKVHIRAGHNNWIVKFPCSFENLNVGYEEFEMNELAQQCGINVNEHTLFPSKTCKGFFGAKRFDRLRGRNIHMISLSSLLETSHTIPNLDYLHLFQVIQKISIDKEDIIEAFRRMCFNVLAQNRDDHGHNFAFIYDEKDKGYRLSPAFDITKTLNKAEHEMTVNGKGIPDDKDLLCVGEIVNIPRNICVATINKIKEVLSQGL